jgi:hypothetical protein
LPVVATKDFITNLFNQFFAQFIAEIAAKIAACTVSDPARIPIIAADIVPDPARVPVVSAGIVAETRRIYAAAEIGGQGAGVGVVESETRQVIAGIRSVSPLGLKFSGNILARNDSFLGIDREQGAANTLHVNGGLQSHLALEH